MMRIGALAARTGVSERLLRYYEEQGLLTPERLPSGYRVYDDSAVATVRHIRALLAAGLNTSTIGVVLPCVRDDGDRIVPTCADMMTRLRTERDRLSAAIADLEASQQKLDEVMAAAPVELTAS
jgi:DNA-binding transcriptional MerR regulator